MIETFKEANLLEKYTILKVEGENQFLSRLSRIWR